MSSNLKVNSLVPATGTEIGIGTTGGSIDFRCPATFGGNVTIGGTLTYDEVINIDSIGVITARSNIDCNGDLDVDGHTNLDHVSISGVTTTTGNITIDGLHSGASPRMLNIGSGNNILRIYENSSQAPQIYTQGDLVLTGATTEIRSKSGSNQLEASFHATNGVKLYHNNNEKLFVNDSGVNITGILTVSGNLNMSSTGRIFVGNGGNASNPMFANISDTNTGIAFPAADTMFFTTAGTERLRIASNGTIGINSTSPGALLDLSSSQPGILFSETGVSANNGKWLNQANASELYWQAQTDAHSGGGNLFKMTRSNEQIQSFEGQQSGTTWFTIRNSDKRVGINQASPRTSLDVNGYVFLGASGQIQITGTSGAKGLQLIGQDDGTSLIGTMGSSGEHLLFRTASNERMRLLVGGPHLLLGGTTSVNEITETSSNSGLVIGNTSMGNGGLAIINSTTGTGRIYFGDSAGANAARNRGQINYYHNGDYMLFATAGTERLRINSDGYVTHQDGKKCAFNVKGSNMTRTNADGYVCGFNNDSSSGCFDSGNNFNTTTHKFVAPVSGYYYFFTNIRLDGYGTGYIRTAILSTSYHAGTAYYTIPSTGHVITYPTNGSGIMTVQTSTVMYVPATHEVWVWQDPQNDTSYTVYLNESSFGGYFIG